jgi:hypothetical protein
MHNKEYCRNCNISVPKITLLTRVRARGSVREREQQCINWFQKQDILQKIITLVRKAARLPVALLTIPEVQTSSLTSNIITLWSTQK